MGEINKSRLESVLMLKKISYKEIDKVINNGGDEENSFKFESLLKGNKPIPKNVERKLFDYLLTDKNLDIKAYVYNETDDINFDIKPKTNKPARRVNIYGATTKDEKMSDEYIANHLDPSVVKDRYRELGFTVATLSLFINENYNKSFAEIMNPNRKKYITHNDENNIGYLLETNYNTLVTRGKKHKAVTEYKVPEYAKYCINSDDDRIVALSNDLTLSEKMIKRLNISEKLYYTVITKKFPVGIKFIELFTKIYNMVFDLHYNNEEFMLGITDPNDTFYDEKEEEVVETPKNILGGIDLSKLPEAWKEANGIEEPKQEEVTTIDKKDIKYSCKCGNVVSDRWIANQKCSLCGTVMRRLGGFDSIEFNTSVVDNATKEEPKSVDDMINEVLEGLANSSCKEDMANAEIENIIDTYNDYKDTISIDKIYSVLKQIIKTEKALKYLDDYNEKQKKLLIESQLREPRAVDLSEVLKPTEVKKEEIMTPEYIINYIDKHFNSLIMDKMIDVLKSKAKAKYNLEVADKFMEELNRTYNYSVSES